MYIPTRTNPPSSPASSTRLKGLLQRCSGTRGQAEFALRLNKMAAALVPGHLENKRRSFRNRPMTLISMRSKMRTTFTAEAVKRVKLANSISWTFPFR